ncbi:guanylate kinase [Ruminococcus flavefaciens]|uniref:guanylate kinase n=1 Tax=Ruminococcus flavefaciens TaxID=1265 RepID=UPI0026EC85F8|nr:guanylate kinase [Ruminococcus flavefaciens]
MNKGRLIVFSAPSGCGKGTMLEEILKDKSFALSVSATTRSPREGEKDGVNYHFLTREDFEQRIADGKFIEHAEYCQNLYGTLVSEVDGRLEQGLNVILEIEPQGAMNIREKRPDAVFIFVVPPSINELRRRLKKRGTETDEVIEERVSKATWEVSQAEKYDYVIVNDALEDAISDFFTVIRAEKLKVDYSGDIINEVLKNA